MLTLERQLTTLCSQRSVPNVRCRKIVLRNNLKYTKYLVDGDTKSYLDVVKNDTYKGVEIQKLECIGHIQKRVGDRLLKIRKDGYFNGCEDEDENSKKKKNKLRLINKDINKLQNYYGIAMRSSTGDTIWQLRKSVAASFYRCCESSSLEQRHQFCPSTDSSWCK